MFDISKEFEKNPELKQDDIDSIQAWVAKQPHLPKLSDHQVVLFLHSCFYRLEATKNTIDSYYTIRTHTPELFSNRNPQGDDVVEAMKTMYITKLRGVSNDGYGIFLSKLARTEPEYYVMADIIKVYNMHGDVLYKDEGTSPGYIIVFDMDGLSFGHVSKMNMSVMKQNLAYLQLGKHSLLEGLGNGNTITPNFWKLKFLEPEGIPIRLKGIHLLNVVPFINIIMNMMKPFMKPELQSLFFFHKSGSDDIYEQIPKSIMPPECGGTGPSIADLHDETKKLFVANTDWFKAEESQRVDESKRQETSTLSSQMFGVIGSFKKISID